MYLNDHVFKCLSKTSDMYILFPGDVTYDHSIQKKFCFMLIIISLKLRILNVGISIPGVIIQIARKLD